MNRPKSVDKTTSGVVLVGGETLPVIKAGLRGFGSRHILAGMTKRATGLHDNQGKHFSLGRSDFARISAVEGIALTPELKRDFVTFDRQGLSAAQRRKILIRKYGTRSS